MGQPLTLPEQELAAALLRALNRSRRPLALTELCRLLGAPGTELNRLIDLLNENVRLQFDMSLIKQAESETLRALQTGATVPWYSMSRVCPYDLLDPQRLYQLVKGRGRISLLTLTDSTSSRLAACLDNAVSGDVIVSEMQTKARGRRGNNWQMGFATQLSLSMAWKFNNVAQLNGLSLIAALAVLKALIPLGLGIKIKWPNDLFLNQGKLCGILVELHQQFKGAEPGEWAVLGIGLNVYHDHDMEQRLGDRTISALGVQGALPLDRTALCAALISSLRLELTRFETCGFAPYRAQWERYDYLKDRQITIELEDGTRFCGLGCGIDNRGCLRLQAGQETRHFASGHILSCGS